ncbi:hypothetical protein N7468_002866 [Penicillium chermesinum]|uniref:Dicer-like protein 2 n=1 Tax=Penicillium chermesinum TaxID=63820 RepID=A0A9W9TYV2_9EURO|nr:uncharacterized protein N7468_002866 [Penicillium chermesinum]KAJ5247883.1 hypothetical protein N7468_002866 [Penicillium chermesinum]
MAPTVALCSQQHEVIASQIPSVKTQVLTGQDNVDRWTQQSEWDAVLRDVRVVVSTYAILADALTHGFVRILQLSLLVFDEGGSSKSLRILEKNLDAICKAPRVHRTELLQHVHRPSLERIPYTSSDDTQGARKSRLMHSLSQSIAAYTAQNLELTRGLCQCPSHDQSDYEAITIKGGLLERQLHKFRQKSAHICQELGAWGADYFISASVDQLRKSLGEEIELSFQDKKWRLELLQALSTLKTLEDPPSDSDISPKAKALVEFLQRMDSPQLSGLIFVQRRATASVLTQLLTDHPATKGRFQCSAYVGWSSGSKRTEGLGDLLTRASQKNTLAEFKSGKKNLIIATDVLEEGLDVSACRLVICFDKPSNLKSFIQRRGRARHHESTFAIMTSTEDDAIDVASWQRLEETMIALYQDEQRQRSEAIGLEDVDEEVPGLLRVPLTGAVDPAVRRTRGRRWWRSQRAASREAAFEAYNSLWEYGLLNNNLLPLIDKPDPISIRSNTLSAEISSCSEQFDPWSEIAQAWSLDKPSSDLYKVDLNITQDGIVNEDLSISIVLPKPIVLPRAIPLYWNDQTDLVASFGSLERLPCTAAHEVSLMKDITAVFLQAPSSRPDAPDRDFVILFIPQIPHAQLEDWNAKFCGVMRLSDFHKDNPHSAPLGIIRNPERYNKPRVFRKWIYPEQGGSQITQVDVTPIDLCTLTRIPASKAMVGLLVPAILDRMEALLVAERLNSTILDGVGIQDLDHVLTAITTPLSQATRNYQRYEFFGDTVLKFVVSCQLFFNNPTWHEGYLSAKRDQIINNERLARSALDAGLDRFVITTQFTQRKWQAPLVCQKLNKPRASRSLALKVLADIPSSPGVMYLSNGFHRDRLVPIIGYKFKDASWLIEALTHPSLDYDTTSRSYQRLEYLGDAVLDMVVISLVSESPIKLSQGQMTMVKHCLVNANLLGFLCMELSATEEMTELVRSSSETPVFARKQEQVHLWRFLRFGAPSVKDARDACLERHRMLRTQILAAMDHSPDYPWELLARLHPDKFMSDIVESMLGAIFVDTAGDLGVCRSFLEKLGLVAYLHKLVNKGINVKHPCGRAQDLLNTQGPLVFNARRIEAAGAPATYGSSAMLGEKELASIEGCASSEEADIRVAHTIISRMTEARRQSPSLPMEKDLQRGDDTDCPE